jgi:hypothetical protein
MCNFTDDGGVHDFRAFRLEQLAPFKIVRGFFHIHLHALSENTRERQRKDVRVVLETKGFTILAILMMLKSCTANPHILALSEIAILKV